MTETVTTYELQPDSLGNIPSFYSDNHPPPDTITLSRADAELLERLAWAGYSGIARYGPDAERLEWQAVLVRLATALTGR